MIKRIERIRDCGNGYGWSIVLIENHPVHGAEFEIAVMQNDKLCYDTDVMPDDPIRGCWDVINEVIEEIIALPNKRGNTMLKVIANWILVMFVICPVVAFCLLSLLNMFFISRITGIVVNPYAVTTYVAAGSTPRAKPFSFNGLRRIIRYRIVCQCQQTQCRPKL